ncbi:hypothetical protein POTOM_006937 [Populus tomentosa]|uniref:Uncharacterized protein n=1 Tax=Populus tomentosa TaxID=118781 RepID=A0A8X8AQ74_POPTO|nr:hypothetical protein POTOM_006937 [Populus tomentosa]
MADTEVGKRGRLHHHHYHHHGASGTRGFRLKYPRRFSVQRFRARFFDLFRFLSRWRSSYGQAVQYLKRGVGRDRGIKRCGSSKKVLVMDATSCHYMEKDPDFFVLLVLPLQECLKVETIPLLALCVYNPESWVAMNLSVAEAREVRRN